MRRLHACRDAEAFRELAWNWLVQEEAIHTLPLGLLSNLLSKPKPVRQEHHLWVVEKDGLPDGTAFWTPPYPLMLTEMEEDSCRLLAEGVREGFPGLNGVGGPADASEAFAAAWREGTGQETPLKNRMRLYQLERVEEGAGAFGGMRTASLEETDLLTGWYGDFAAEVGEKDGMDPRTLVRGYLKEGRLFVWEDRGVRAMAGTTGETPRGLRINMVYTPAGSRGKGYAGSLVSALCRGVLEKGKSFCTLFADSSTPADGRLYRRIGFKPAAQWSVYRLGPG
jgi:predicted GNAT family acetyltransferase